MAQQDIDFANAAYRHLKDADYLSADGRIANACQLYGFVAECGIKALMIQLGYPTDAYGSPQPLKKKRHNLREHVNTIAQNIQFIELFVDSRIGAKYISMIPKIGDFSGNWSVDHRYYSSDSLVFQNSPAWQAAAYEVGVMLDQARIDGTLS